MSSPGVSSGPSILAEQNTIYTVYPLRSTAVNYNVISHGRNDAELVKILLPNDRLHPDLTEVYLSRDFIVYKYTAVYISTQVQVTD